MGELPGYSKRILTRSPYAPFTIIPKVGTEWGQRSKTPLWNDKRLTR
jgi:hypothetical protein